MYKITIDKVTIDIFGNGRFVACEYKDFMFYCIKVFETTQPTEEELRRDFIYRTRVSLKDGLNQEILQEAFTNMIKQVKKDFLSEREIR